MNKRTLTITAIALLALLFFAPPLSAGQPNRERWVAYAVTNLCGEEGNIHATGLPETPYVKLIRVVDGGWVCLEDYCTRDAPPSDLSAAAFDDPGTSLFAYHRAKLVLKLHAWLFTVDQDGTTILVTRRK